MAAGCRKPGNFQHRIPGKPGDDVATGIRQVHRPPVPGMAMQSSTILHVGFDSIHAIRHATRYPMPAATERRSAHVAFSVWIQYNSLQ